MKSLSRVVWSEGMYLGPHHFQTQGRYFEDSVRFAIEHSWFEPWGIVTCKLDDAAIRNGRVSVLGAHGIFEDGMVFEMPDSDPVPAPRDIRDSFSPLSESLTILLAVPERRPAYFNCDVEGKSLETRYRAVSRQVMDVNSGSDEKEIKIGEKNIRLIAESEVVDGLLTIPVARVRRDGAGHLVYDPTFIPPCTKLTASERLLTVLRLIVELLEEKRNALARPKVAAGSFQAGTTQLEIANFWFLHTVNSGLTALRHLYLSKRGHPEELFRELSGLAGALCTFGVDSDPGTLPIYGHRGLDRCFDELTGHIRRHLEILVPTNTVSIPLKLDRRNFYSAEVKDPRCFGRSRWILGVKAGGSEARLIAKTPEIVKICSQEWVGKLVVRALPGLALAHLPVAPPAISPKVDLHYFAIDQNGPCWNHMIDTRHVGIYVPDELAGVELELHVIFES